MKDLEYKLLREFRINLPGMSIRLLNDLVRDRTEDPARYRRLDNWELIERWIRMGAIEISSATSKILYEHLNVFASDQIEVVQIKKFWEVLEVATDWKSYKDDNSRDLMMWALYSRKNPALHHLGVLLGQYFENNNLNIRAFLETIAAIPRYVRSDVELELRVENRALLREQRKKIETLETELGVLKRQRQETRTPEDESRQVQVEVSHEYCVTKADYQSLDARLREADRNLKRAIGELTALKGVYDAAKNEIDALRGRPRHHPVKYDDFLRLQEFYRGRKVITVGGYSGNAPKGTTESYISFLRDKLGCDITSYPKDINPARIRETFSGMKEETVVIAFTYCLGHNLTELISNANPKYFLRINQRTYHEQDFLQELLKPTKVIDK